ncbi:MAG: protein translocase subunit SecF, partial [Candidatus Zixiibacteriota bacterium]
MFRIIRETNINFIGNRRKAFLLSALLILLGLFAFVMILLDKANMGIDFAGGTMLQGNFDSPINIADLRDAVTVQGFPEASIQELQRYNVPNSYMIRVKETSAGEEKAVDKLMSI